VLTPGAKTQITQTLWRMRGLIKPHSAFSRLFYGRKR
jgi:hypothetical protein